jgi:hypothetical protein
METTAASHANNLFPTVKADAPDIEEERAAKPAPVGFPSAPVLKAGSIAAEIASLGGQEQTRTGTKTEQALAYLASCSRETASREDLASVIGVKPTDIVAYLKAALTSGRITRSGNLFSVGVEPAPGAPKQTTAAAKVPKSKAKAKVATSDTNQPPTPTPKAPKAEEPPSGFLPIATLSVSGFSVAVWSDGAMDVRTGSTTVSLNQLQMGVLQMFLQLIETAGPNNG